MLRKIKLGGVILGALLALVGCQSEKLVNDGGSQQGQQFTLTASRGIQSRTNLGTEKNTLQLRWSAGDKIYVSSKDGKTTGVLTIKEGDENKPSATFSGFVFGHPEDLYYSVYPVPNEDGKIEMTGVVGNEYKIPMVGEISSREVQFVNTCGIGYMSDSDSEGNMDMPLYAGTDENNLISLACIAEINEEKLKSEGVLEFIYTEHPQKSITLSNVAPIDGKFYFPYDLQNNKGKSVKFFTGEGTTKTQLSTDAIDIPSNSDVQTFNTGISISVSEDGEVKVAEKKEVADGKVSIAEYQPIVVVPEVAEEVTIEMPVNLEGEDKAVVSIEEIKSEDATITITSASTSQKVSEIENLTVILPSGTTEEEVADKVVIDMPNTTVTIKSDDGQILKIGTVEARTSPNTFIVGTGVYIDVLEAKEGSIEIWGTVDLLKRGNPHYYSEGEKTEVFIKKGGVLNNIVNEKDFEIYPKPETPESISVSDFTQLKSALESQPQTETTLINVNKNITLTEPLVINKRVQLNLGDKSLTIAENFPWDNTEAAIISNANLHISRGSIVGYKTIAEGKYLLKSTEALNMFNVELITNGVSNGISQVNKGIIFRGNTSITATKGNAVHVLINQTEPGLNGVQLQENTIINGSVAFELTCKPVEKADVSICVLQNSKLNGKLDIIKNGFESYIRVENNNESGGAEGKPVANKEELEAALKDSKVTNIILTKPIEVNNLALRFKTLTLSPDIFEGSTADAAITVVSDEEAQICDGIIVGDINDANKYIVKSTAPTLGVLNATIEAKGGMNAVYVKDAKFVLNTFKDTQKVIPTIVTSTDGYALYLVAETSPVFANIYEGTTIGGTIHYYNNSYDGKDMSYLDIYGTINGHLTVDGQFKDALYKHIDNNAQIGEDFTGWPRTKVKVDNYEELEGYLDYNNPENDLIREIIIAAPIEINVNGRLDLNLGFKKIKVIDGFWEKYNEAIILKKSPDAEYCSIDINGAATPYEIKGSTNAAEKYFIKSDGVGVSFNNGNLIMEGALNAVFIKDSFCSLSGSKITTSEAGYAVDMNVSGTESEALLHLMKNSQIIGPIRYNFNTQDPGFDSTVKVEGNSTINGKLTVLGNIQRFKVVKVSGTIEGIGWLPYLPGDNTDENEGEGGEDEGGTTIGNVTNGNTSGEGFKNGGEF